MSTATLQFTTMIGRIVGLQKFKKAHCNVKVIKSGYATTGCGRSYYWVKVQYES